MPTGLLGGGGGGGSQNTTSTVTQQPPAYLQPYLTAAAGNAQDAFTKYQQAGLNAPYTGQNLNTPAIANISPQPTSADLAAQRIYGNVANSIAPNAGQTSSIANNLSNQISSGMFTSPANSYQYTPMSDSALSGNIAAQLAPLKRTLTEQTLPQIDSNAIKMGAYGGSQNGTVEARALQDFDKQASDATAQAVYSNEALNASLGEQQGASQRTAATAGNAQTLQADAAVPTIQNLATQQALQPGDLQSAIGATQRGFTANDIAAAMQLYAGQQGQPFGGIGTVEGLLAGSAPGGTGVSTNSVPSAGNFANILGGALGANSASQALFGSGLKGDLSFLGSAGSSAIAGNSFDAGAFLSGLPWSDRRLKSNITRIGRVAGINIYSFQYTHDPNKTYAGVIAQELLATHPEAVHERDGYLCVDYSILPVEFKQIH